MKNQKRVITNGLLISLLAVTDVVTGSSHDTCEVASNRAITAVELFQKTQIECLERTVYGMGMRQTQAQPYCFDMVADLCPETAKNFQRPQSVHPSVHRTLDLLRN